MKSRLFGLGIGLTSGVLAAFAFPPYHQPWLAFIGLTPILALAEKRKGKRLGLPFFGFGVGFYTFGLSWLAVVITPLGPFALSFVLTVLFSWPTTHDCGRGAPPSAQAAAMVLEAVPPGALTAVRFTWRRKYVPTEADQARLDAAVARACG